MKNNFFENIDIINIIQDNIIWIIIVIIFIYPLLEIFKAIKISCFLLKNNRYGFNHNELSGHYADRFMEIYKSMSNNKKISYAKSQYNFRCYEKSYYKPIVADEKLLEMNLILKNNLNSKLSINNKNIYSKFRNYLIYKILKFVSIYIYRDNKNIF